MPLIQALSDNATAATAVLFTVLALIPLVHRLYFHPLSHVPGPLLGRLSSVFMWIICYLGIEGRVYRYYHQKRNSKVLRIGPNSVSISDSAAIRDIYIKGGGFQKDSRYNNFDLGPIVSIFSSTDTDYRDTRAKAVAPLFSPGRLRAASEPGGVIGDAVAEYVEQVRACKTTAQAKSGGHVKADILDLSARLSIDVVTGYLLNERYGGLREHDGIPIETRHTQKLSANPFISTIVAFSRFSLLPKRLFQLAYSISSKINFDDEMAKAFARLDKFADQVVSNAISKSRGAESAYQGRLMDAGVSETEAAAQSKAIVFAGADSVAVMQSTIIFHLIQNPNVRARIKQEIKEQGGKSSITDPQALPYLRAVIKEGLRLGMANPLRFTRVVPAGGLTVADVHIPPGTIVGCAAYVLHHDPDVFPEPFAFKPERWLEDGEDNGLRRPNMERSMIPFGAGRRECLGKNLAQQQIFETILAVVDSDALDGARTCKERIEMVEWFNGEIKGHKLEIEWPGCAP